MTRARLRHIALHTPDPAATAEFYKRVFDLEEVGRTDNHLAEGIYLSDGHVNIAVLRFKLPEAADRLDGLGPVLGLHHFGFAVDDLDATRDRLRAEGAAYRSDLQRDSKATGNFEEKYRGPDSVMIDIARGWVLEARAAEKAASM